MSARLHTATKQQLLATGYNTAECLECFAYMYSKNAAFIRECMMELRINNLQREIDKLQGAK